MNSETNLNRGLLSVLFVATICWFVLTVIFSMITYQHQIYAELEALKLVPENTPFTELYFENPASLPSQITPNKSLSFAFTIHNVEGATTTYPYLVSIQDSMGQESTILEGTTSLADNASVTIPVEYSSTAPNQRDSEITINLTSLNQQIDFYVETETQP